MLQFGILGPLEVARDGGAVQISGQRQRAVLTFLLLNANHVVTSERLVSELWGEEPPPTALTSLHNAVSQLRKALGSDTVETRPPGYVLHVEQDALDLERFEALVAEACDAPAAKRVQLLNDALALWRGPPLADFGYEAFAQGEIRRLEELQLTAIEDRVDAELELDRHAALVGPLERLVLQHPHRERLRRQLMLALYRSGRQGEALQTYQAARRALAEDLGLDPGPALRQLHGAILRQEVPHAAADEPRHAPAQDHLFEVADAVRAGRVVPVLGEDASALAARLAERFRYPEAEGGDVARVSQYAAVTRGYGPLYDEVHAYAENDDTPSGVHRMLASLPPLLRDRGAAHQLIVTAAYGRALEQAFADAGEEVDVVAYVAAGPNRGKFCHRAPDGTMLIVGVPNKYADELSLERRTVILKVRGQIDPSPAREWESFVVTEDDYLEFLSAADVAGGVPVGLAARFRRSHFLFLGYSMRDWSLRAVLGRMWGEQPVTYRSWAVHPEPRAAEREFWRRVDVDLLEWPLDAYAAALADALGVANVVPT